LTCYRLGSPQSHRVLRGSLNPLASEQGSAELSDSQIHSRLTASLPFNHRVNYTVEIIDDTPVHPNWVPLMTTHIAAEKDDATQCIRMRLDEVKVFADGSGLNGHVGAAAAVISPSGGRHLQFQLGSDAMHTVFEGELTGILLTAPDM